MPQKWGCCISERRVAAIGVVQDESSKLFSAVIWEPEVNKNTGFAGEYRKNLQK